MDIARAAGGEDWARAVERAGKKRQKRQAFGFEVGKTCELVNCQQNEAALMQTETGALHFFSRDCFPSKYVENFDFSLRARNVVGFD